MAKELNYSPDIHQALQFDRTVHHLVGHIDSLSIGGNEIGSKFVVQDPEDIAGGAKKEVFAVLDSIYWEGGFTDPISFSGRVSVESKTQLSILTQSEMQETNVALAFTIFEYDEKAGVYFPCFHTDGAEINADINNQGGNLEIGIDTQQAMEVAAPKNFPFNIGIMPPEDQEAQDIHVAFSVSDKLVKQWGVQVAA